MYYYNTFHFSSSSFTRKPYPIARASFFNLLTFALLHACPTVLQSKSTCFISMIFPFASMTSTLKNGKIVEMKHVDLDCKTVGQACNSAKVNKLKKDARAMGYGFRVKLEEEEK